MDYVANAAAVLQENEHTNSSFFNTFHLFYSEEKKKVLDIGALKGAINRIILDTGCIRTVTGKTWMNNLIASMDPDTRKLIKIDRSSHGFKFGVGDAQRSLGKYIIPTKLGSSNFLLTTDVIETDIPCLLSKAAMVKSNMVIDMANNTIDMFNNKVDMVKVPSGHSAIVIKPYNMEKRDEFFSFVAVPENEKYDLKRIRHIHEQLGHPSQTTMEVMFKTTNIIDENIKSLITQIYKSCAICLIHRKTKARPKVSAPIAQNLNDTVCMDLKIWPKRGVIILYIIDVFSRFTSAFIVPDKRPESIIKPLLESWILTRFGAPRVILVDNGGEFVNRRMTDVCQNFNVKIFTTARYSPYQNGICERNHSTVDEIIDRMMTSSRYTSVRDALGAAIFAKNIRITSLGFSPYQIVFGSNPRIPGAIENEPPAEHGTTITSLVQRRLQAIFDARKAMAEVENKHRLKMADKSSHTGKFEFYNMGDEVYYKLAHNSKWSGPGKVIAQDNKLIFIRHGRNMVVASPSRTQRVSQQFKQIAGNQRNHERIGMNSKNETNNNASVSESEDDENQLINKETNNQAGNDEKQLLDESVEEPSMELEENMASSNTEETRDNKMSTSDTCDSSRATSTSDTCNSSRATSNSDTCNSSRAYPKVGNFVYMRLKGDEHHEWERVKIWQRVTKGAQSPNGPYFNWEKED